MKFHRIYRSVQLNWGGGGGGGAEYKENPGAQSLATSEKDSLENLVQATREPQMIKSKDSRPVSVSLDPAQSQNQPQMTLVISGYHVHSPSSRCWGTHHAHQASRQGGSQEQARARVVSHLTLLGYYRPRKHNRSRGPVGLPEGGHCREEARRNQEAAGLRGKLCSNWRVQCGSLAEDGFQFKSKLKTTARQTFLQVLLRFKSIPASSTSSTEHWPMRKVTDKPSSSSVVSGSEQAPPSPRTTTLCPASRFHPLGPMKSE